MEGAGRVICAHPNFTINQRGIDITCVKCPDCNAMWVGRASARKPGWVQELLQREENSKVSFRYPDRGDMIEGRGKVIGRLPESNPRILTVKLDDSGKVIKIHVNQVIRK